MGHNTTQLSMWSNVTSTQVRVEVMVFVVSIRPISKPLLSRLLYTRSIPTFPPAKLANACKIYLFIRSEVDLIDCALVRVMEDRVLLKCAKNNQEINIILPTGIKKIVKSIKVQRKNKQHGYSGFKNLKDDIKASYKGKDHNLTVVLVYV